MTWRRQAACIGTDLDVWFPERSPSRLVREMCASCPVQPECLEEALLLPRDMDHGYIGGTTAKERNAIRQDRDIVWQSI